MILDKFIEIQINFSSRKKYKDYIIDDVIKCPVESLSRNSHYKINVKCDICGKEKKLTYQVYNDKTDNQTTPYHCNNKDCINKKRKEALQKKYGIDNVFQLEEIKEKIKETNIEKYGTENPHQNQQIKEKAEITNLEKYGCKNPFQSEEIKEKSRKTCLKRYGVEYPIQSEEIKEKSRQTCFKNHGVEYSTQNPEIFHKQSVSSFYMNKYKDTNLTYQGSYELDFLDKYYDKVKIENGPTIKYMINNETHWYHSDFYLPDYNLVVEIKSSYWYEVHEECVLAKEKETKTHYNYLLVLDKNYEKLNKLFNI